MIKTARTVGELRKLIEGLPGDTKILSASNDHSYCESKVVFGEAVYNEVFHWWSEYHGPKYLSKGELVKKALIVE